MNSPQEQILKERNTELEKALSEKTVELQKKNREIGIETALEKVRARTMAMQKSEELADTASLLFKQVNELGVKTFSCGFQIWEENGLYTTAYMSPDGVTRSSFMLPLTEHPYFKKIHDARQKGEDFFAMETGGKELQEMYQYLFNVPGFIHDLQDIEDFWLKLPPSQINHSAFFSQGFLSFITPEPVPEAHDIFKRFAKVFEQTYTRFLDLQKAEAQAREAQIQLAMERVRARTMAMQRSDELGEAAQLLFQTVGSLEVSLWTCGFFIWNDDRKTAAAWMGSEQGILSTFNIPNDEHIFLLFYEAAQRGESLHVVELKGEAIDTHYKYMLKIPTAGDRLKNITASGGTLPAIQILHAAYFAQGYLLFITYAPVPEAWDIFKRFAKVFEQTYTRFLDLQKAEAQARESQIQLALERVRAKTMAMQKPSEFVDVINIIGEQFVHLGFDIDWVNFGANGLEISKGIDIWNFAVIPGASPISARVFIPYFDHPVFTTSAATINEFINGGKDFITVTLDKQTKDTWLDHMFTKTIFKDVPEEYRVIQYAKPGYSTSNISLKDTWLSIGKFDIKNFTDEQHAILRRFANAFGQAYTRFLDLQKAEAQARESQIQLALERVRARTMAMQKSDELNELIKILFSELRHLEISLDRCLIMTYDPQTLDSTWWMASRDDISYKTGLLVPYHTNSPQLAYIKGWQERKEKWTYLLEGDEKKEWDEFLFGYTALAKLPDEVIAGMRNLEKNFSSASFKSFGCLTTGSFEPLTDEAFDILIRFTQVFDQAYTRFLDLQTAEAQAREAQIELSLERVRAKTMAMHNSQDVGDTVATMFDELVKLGVQTNRCGILIFSNTNNAEVWTAKSSAEGAVTLIIGLLDVTIHPMLQGMRNAWKTKEPFFFYEMVGDDIRDYYNAINNYPGYPTQFDIGSLPSKEIHSDFFFSEGAIFAFTSDPIPAEASQIFKRFSGVFGQTYRRYLDLKKAEAQARDAQIEASLERVRASAMAMHRSDELSNVLAILFEQFDVLKIQPVDVHLDLFDLEKNTFSYRATGKEGKRVIAEQIVDLGSRPEWQALLQKWKNGKPNTVDFSYYPKEVIKELMVFFPDIWAAMPEDAIMSPEDFPDGIFDALGFCKFGYIGFHHYRKATEEEQKILIRFANEFERLYQRFLDLQKAEARVREAQIESSLERVRSKTMAMHNSQDVGETVAVMFDELRKLDVETLRCGVGIMLENYQMELWTARPDATGKAEFIVGHIDMKLHPLLTGGYEAWKNRDEDFFYQLKDEDLKTYFDAINSHGAYPAKYDTSSLPSLMFHYEFNFNEGCLFAFSIKQFSDESSQIFKRFSGVFGQTYRRYLDLKKAEAQAKEAQIELSLERVRAKTMAMHNSQDVGDTVATMFAEFVHLGIRTNRCGILIFDDNDSAEVWTARTVAEGKATLIIGKVDLNIYDLLSSAYKSWKDKKPIYQYELHGDDIVRHYEAINRSEYYPIKFDMNALPQKEFHSDFFFPEGAVFAFTAEPIAEEHAKIMKRFAGVFGQTYRRYLDLQKAEAQAREAQIEVALERVRARAMAMQKSDELKELIGTVFIELTKLDLVLTRCLIMIYDTTTNGSTWWMANSEAPSDPIGLFVKYHEHPPYLAYINAWKERNLKWQYILDGAVKKDWDDFLFVETELSLLPDFVIEGMKAPDRVYLNSSFNSFGNLTLASLEPLSDEHFDILLRFAKVFDLTYTRFNDLKQAEAQAREAKIEAALERVRARTMAMHNSEDVVNATSVLLNELRKLGIETLRCGILIFQQSETFEVWSVTNTVEGETVRSISTFNTNDHPLWQGLYKSWKQGDEFFYYYLAGEEKKAYYRILSNTPNYLSVQVNELPDQNFQGYCFIEGAIWTFSLQPHSEEDKQVMKKFTSVFSLTFRRYQDLKKAEAQAREAQIEAALERVRARTMAMFKSDELAETAVVVFKQMNGLGIIPNRLYIVIINDDSGNMEFWITDENGDKIGSRHMVSINENISLKTMYDGWSYKKKTIIIDQQGNELQDWLSYWKENFGVSFKDDTTIKRRVQTIAYFSKGFIAIASPDDEPRSTMNLLERFAAVFNLTYTRFNDLQIAEIQAREAQIEAALERVRGKAMAMQNSNDLSVAASMVFAELRKLGINPIRCGVGLLNKESHKAQLYSATSSADGDHLSLVGWVQLEKHPVLEKIYDSWLQQYDYFPELQGEGLRSYYQLLLAGLSVAVPDTSDNQKQYGHFLPFSVGCLYAWSGTPYNETEIKILKRFAAIIDLTFRRYIELQKSEANAREAVKQAALDRVRAEIASMRTITDLDKITPLIWNELNILGVPFIRCGVFLMDDLQKLIHTFLSTPDGKAIAAFHLPYDTPGNFAEMIKRWHNKQIYIDHWGETEFISMAETLVKQGAIATKEQYLNTLPDDGFYLHFLPFLQGMLYVGNTTKLGEEEIHLIQSVADAFSTAYARYEDFNKLESAKVQIEKTLVDLKQTQAQLVQSEKMASLGELTAGIAHEIQNPLNFVNNFSEVSTELLDEMITELKSDNKEDAIAIADDVKQNLEKILHHGKRADGIVKGMLQHSRSSSATKEATDINKLADEYFRLAYHGLRAKDKSFNATMITDYDETIGNINIIPQDIGRVILNLIMNAFYTVAEKKKQMHDHYEPTVSLTTKKINDKIEIKIRDNGNGIPGKVIDKIFQPFFTTKPTGQGTGLGLSLAYDIIKTHNGELKVDTKEGEGSEFIIQLPV